MIIACILSGMAGTFIGACFMAICAAGANADKIMENEYKRGQ